MSPMHCACRQKIVFIQYSNGPTLLLQAKNRVLAFEKSFMCWRAYRPLETVSAAAILGLDEEQNGNSTHCEGVCGFSGDTGRCS